MSHKLFLNSLNGMLHHSVGTDVMIIENIGEIDNVIASGAIEALPLRCALSEVSAPTDSPISVLSISFQSVYDNDSGSQLFPLYYLNEDHQLKTTFLDYSSEKSEGKSWKQKQPLTIKNCIKTLKGIRGLTILVTDKTNEVKVNGLDAKGNTCFETLPGWISVNGKENIEALQNEEIIEVGGMFQSAVWVTKSGKVMFFGDSNWFLSSYNGSNESESEGIQMTAEPEPLIELTSNELFHPRFNETLYPKEELLKRKGELHGIFGPFTVSKIYGEKNMLLTTDGVPFILCSDDPSRYIEDAFVPIHPPTFFHCQSIVHVDQCGRYTAFFTDDGRVVVTDSGNTVIEKVEKMKTPVFERKLPFKLAALKTSVFTRGGLMLLTVDGRVFCLKLTLIEAVNDISYGSPTMDDDDGMFGDESDEKMECEMDEEKSDDSKMDVEEKEEEESKDQKQPEDDVLLADENFIEITRLIQMCCAPSSSTSLPSSSATPSASAESVSRFAPLIRWIKEQCNSFVIIFDQ
eukprot:MONOS_5631.1-p1 / transcript=MONOS_5631.1 / gene=MONOS_5631 / organism=Monocercomonoides_exilis_PA203 / gene_product=unspecified product / transcript_product=unspecified product / location=Mono_scaffold00166:40735-42652(+) / protein_length=518 / sequence_SO=supercontig / SO=protein_coding / is_pseudo=false